MKSRKVSYEERVEIVKYCITNNDDYKNTAAKYNVAYSQVYAWVKKVREKGYESLKLQQKGPKPRCLVEPKTPEEILELENERLRRENERLQLEVEVLKKASFTKASQHSKVRLEEYYLTVDYFSNLGYKIQIICEILGINRSSYYKWKNRKIPEKEYQDQELSELIVKYDCSYNHILGYRRMTMYINRLNNTNYSWKYIRRLMRKLKIKSKIRRKRYNYIKVQPEQVGENVLSRDFTSNYPNENG